MTPLARKARAAQALRSLPGVVAASNPRELRHAAPDNALVRAGLARPTPDGFELTEKGATFLSRAGS